MEDITHASLPPDTAMQLSAYIRRLEQLLDEIDILKDSLKELKAAIKSDGFNVKAVERVVACGRNKEAADKEAEFINDVILYASITGTPLAIENHHYSYKKT